MSDTNGNPIPDIYRQGTDASFQLYRINLNPNQPDYDDTDVEYWVSDAEGRDAGWLVPDTRLQAIADAPRTRWCDEHNLPYSAIRTGDDRMVCWFVWWTEAMDRAATSSPVPVVAAPCRSSERIVIEPQALTQEDTPRDDHNDDYSWLK